MLKFKTLGMKIIVFSFSILIITGVIFMILYYYNTNSALMNEKEAQTKALIDSVTGVFENLNHQVENGDLTLQEAQEQAKGYIGMIRYDGDNYFFVLDQAVHMIFHPINLALNGTDLSNNKDPNGVYLFVEMEKVASRDGAGVVDYYWEKPGSSQPEPKVSYVKLFKPWGWILGTGIYVDDVNATLISTSMIMILAVVIIVISAILIALIFGKSISKRVKDLKDKVAKFAEKDLNVQFRETGHDEITDMAFALNDMAKSLEDSMKEIKTMSDNMQQSSGSLAAVVEEQVASTEEISADISDITSNFHDLSSSIEEVNAGVEEISSGSQNLANVTRDLTENASGRHRMPMKGRAVYPRWDR